MNDGDDNNRNNGQHANEIRHSQSSRKKKANGNWIATKENKMKVEVQVDGANARRIKLKKMETKAIVRVYQKNKPFEYERNCV